MHEKQVDGKMTNKEAIIDSLDKLTTPNGKILPLAFPYFLVHMAALIGWVCDCLLSEDFYTVQFGNGEKFDGKAKKHTSFLDACQVLVGDDLLRHSILFSQVSGFIDWFLEQDAALEEERFWYDSKTLAELWNEYAHLKNGEKNAD